MPNASRVWQIENGECTMYNEWRNSLERISTQIIHYSIFQLSIALLSGDDSRKVPPVPIPNTVVKLSRVDNTWRATAREDRSLPEQRNTARMLMHPGGIRWFYNEYSSIAQLVEHAAVNWFAASRRPQADEVKAANTAETRRIAKRQRARRLCFKATWFGGCFQILLRLAFEVKFVPDAAWGRRIPVGIWLTNNKVWHKFGTNDTWMRVWKRPLYPAG